MSEFASNLLTYTVVTLAVAGGYLGGVELENVSRSQVDSAAFADPLLLTNAPQDTSGEVQVASNAVLFDPSVIRQAELHSVVFSSTGAATSHNTLVPVDENLPTGTVSGGSVNLRSGPGTSYAIAGRAAGGDKLEVTGARDGVWFEVVAPISGDAVWIHGNYFNAPG